MHGRSMPFDSVNHASQINFENFRLISGYTVKSLVCKYKAGKKIRVRSHDLTRFAV